MAATAVGGAPSWAQQECWCHRVTRTGRSLWYLIDIVQQPGRARASGTGTKGSNDTRPIDPPPVVALRIVEGTSVDEGIDITFEYKSDFFLFANLEQAHATPHGAAEHRKPAVLGGLSATGMVYLQRPRRAGYFVFADLGVRYEGHYKLRFSLFEVVRDAADADADADPGPEAETPTARLRSEFRSQPFNVYNSNKFPGMEKSTQLSVTLAQQGCRIRIRREIRVRKPEDTPPSDSPSPKPSLATLRSSSVSPQASATGNQPQSSLLRGTEDRPAAAAAPRPAPTSPLPLSFVGAPPLLNSPDAALHRWPNAMTAASVLRGSTRSMAQAAYPLRNSSASPGVSFSTRPPAGRRPNLALPLPVSSTPASRTSPQSQPPVHRLRIENLVSSTPPTIPDNIGPPHVAAGPAPCPTYMMNIGGLDMTDTID